MNNLPEVEIYTDGACSGNPGPGGWAAILRYGDQEKEISGGEKETTNNRMEVQAALEALRALNRPSRIRFHTDSAYLLNGATSWLKDWKRRDWKRKHGQLQNVDLWKEMDFELARHQIDWVWVKGHAGNPMNERVDELARKAIPH
ncbi:MAG: ribonuclease HI [Anaerolineaceae bacterium]|nr:ribonuclease HI [Chloroflexota bacterium]HZK17383.1 ribonuclease HI [Anaerolineaceae bacterium]